MADVIGRFGPSYRASYDKAMLPSHREALESLAVCRTPAAGGQVVRCADCGTESYVWRSCRNRACTKCTRLKGEDWLQARRAELLPVPYFHIVFTVPESLRRTFRKHQEALYSAIMASSSETLTEVARDPRHLGGDIGVMAVLHTWTRTLEYHPHVHCLVPAGYLDSQGGWHEVSRPWLAPHEVLANVFRAKLCAKMRAAVPRLQLPGSAYSKPWVVHVDLPLHGKDVVLTYLARYVHRGPMSESRLLSMDDKFVTFKYRDRERKDWKVMTLKGREFLRRYLQHVLPKGFHRVRYYGFWATAKRPQLKILRAKLVSEAGRREGAAAAAPVARRECRCRACDSNRVSIVRFFGRGDPIPQLRHPGTASGLVPTPIGSGLSFTAHYKALTARWVLPIQVHPPPGPS